MPNGQNNIVNPWEYLSEYSTPYSTTQAYQDIGYTPNQDFLQTIDEETGLSYADLIPEYDPYEEQRMRTEFKQGAQSAYESSVGQLGGVMGQSRQAEAAAGFAGSGTTTAMETSARGELERGYGQAFKGALLDLSSGIRSQRTGYQDALAGLLQSFGGSAFENDSSVVGGDDIDPPEGQYGTDYDSCIQLGKSTFICTQMWET